MEENLLKLAEVGGPVVITVLIFIWYLWKKAQLDNTRENNHMAHSTAATDRLADALNNIAKSETKLADAVRDCPYKK
jgi:hypothetical protein